MKIRYLGEIGKFSKTLIVDAKEGSVRKTVDTSWASVLGKSPIGEGISYFEIEILSTLRSFILIGLVPARVSPLEYQYFLFPTFFYPAACSRLRNVGRGSFARCLSQVPF